MSGPWFEVEPGWWFNLDRLAAVRFTDDRIVIGQENADVNGWTFPISPNLKNEIVAWMKGGGE